MTSVHVLFKVVKRSIYRANAEEEVEMAANNASEDP
jgi:hypothetical protein